MKHLVGSFRDVSLAEGVAVLEAAHEFLVAACIAAVHSVPEGGPSWGAQMKRLWVEFPEEGRPALVHKDRERFGEAVNMVATVERLLVPPFRSS